MNEVRMRELARIRERLESLFEHSLTGSDLAPSLAAAPWKPPVDVAETDEAYHLTFELPGISRDRVDLHLEGRKLVLQGSRDSARDGRRYLRMERSHGDFSREVELGAALDPDGIEARLARGLLTVKVSKRRPHKVEIRTVGEKS